jgi:hypothetical protein
MKSVLQKKIFQRITVNQFDKQTHTFRNFVHQNNFMKDYLEIPYTNNEKKNQINGLKCD